MRLFYQILCVRIMMETLSFASEEIAKNDTLFQDIIKKEDLIIQWIIEDGGPSFYFKIEDGDFHSITNQEHSRPDIKILIHNLESAIKVLHGSVEVLEKQIEEGNISIIGVESKITQLFFILKQIEEYMIDLRD